MDWGKVALTSTKSFLEDKGKWIELKYTLGMQERQNKEESRRTKTIGDADCSAHANAAGNA